MFNIIPYELFEAHVDLQEFVSKMEALVSDFEKKGMDLDVHLSAYQSVYISKNRSLS